MRRASQGCKGAPDSRPSQASSLDDELTELLAYFVKELLIRVDVIDDALHDGDRTRLTKVANELKEAGGGYGFPNISKAAAAVESLALAEEGELAALTEKVEALIAECRRAATFAEQNPTSVAAYFSNGGGLP